MNYWWKYKTNGSVNNNKIKIEEKKEFILQLINSIRDILIYIYVYRYICVHLNIQYFWHIFEIDHSNIYFLNFMYHLTSCEVIKLRL